MMRFALRDGNLVDGKGRVLVSPRPPTPDESGKHILCLRNYVDPGPQPGNIYLPEVKTYVYASPKHPHRQRRVTEILTTYGFRNWSFHFGETTPAYWVTIPRDHARLLRTHEPPLLILEDDIEPRAFSANIAPPSECQAAYLGGGRGGDLRGVNNARRAKLRVRRSYSYGYTPIDGTDGRWMRIYGMWFTHALLWLDKAAMLEVADFLDSPHRQLAPIDTTLACEQWRWQVHCLTTPMFWQNDGHHFTDTYEYAPDPEFAAKQIDGKCKRLPFDRAAAVRASRQRQTAKH